MGLLRFEIIKWTTGEIEIAVPKLPPAVAFAIPVAVPVAVATVVAGLSQGCLENLKITFNQSENEMANLSVPEWDSCGNGKCRGYCGKLPFLSFSVSGKNFSCGVGGRPGGQLCVGMCPPLVLSVSWL